MLRICIFTIVLSLSEANFEGFVVGGILASITEFPHASSMTVNCVTAEVEKYSFGCGSSILNQELILTAAHCLFECTHSNTRISFSMGNENKLQGVRRYALSFVCHENYDPRTSGCDIALVKMSKDVQLGAKIRRVAVMKSPPYNEAAMLAGWGIIDESTNTYGYELKKVDQIVWEHKKCINLLRAIPKGTFCACSEIKSHYPARGDSGSALVVRGYIQIGLVSYKQPSKASNVLVYTDVGYHYNWIEYNAQRLCEACRR